MSKCKGDKETALFYIQKVRENNWSRATLLNFVDTDLYERQGKAISNFKEALESPQGDLAQEITIAERVYCRVQGLRFWIPYGDVLNEYQKIRKFNN